MDLSQSPIGEAAAGGTAPLSGMIGKVVALGAGISAGRNRGTTGTAGWVSSLSFLARLDEGAPDGTVWRAVVPTLPSGSAAFADK